MKLLMFSCQHLNLFLIGLLQIKLLDKLDNDVFSNDDIVFVEADCDFFTFFSDDMDLNTLDLNSISLDHGNFDDNDP